MTKTGVRSRKTITLTPQAPAEAPADHQPPLQEEIRARVHLVGCHLYLNTKYFIVSEYVGFHVSRYVRYIPPNNIAPTRPRAPINVLATDLFNRRDLLSSE